MPCTVRFLPRTLACPFEPTFEKAKIEGANRNALSHECYELTGTPVSANNP